MSNMELQERSRAQVRALSDSIRELDARRDALVAARDDALWRARLIEGVPLVSLRADAGLSKRGLDLAIARGRDAAGARAELS